MSQWHSRELQELIQSSGVNPETGLTDQEAAQRLSTYGRNRLVEETQIRFLAILKEEITEPMILLLIAVGVLYSVLGSITDALTIIVIIIILVLVEVWNEYRAKRSIAALRKLAPPTAVVLRKGQPREVQTAFLVPGDVIMLQTGQRVPADARLLSAFGLEVDEASLTGESFPVAKDANAVLASETRIMEQVNMVFAGTVVNRGQAKALITATGVNTEVGRVAGLAKSTKILLKGKEVEITDAQRQKVANNIVAMAQSGERLLAFGYRRLPAASKLEKTDLEQNLVFVGIVGFIDPPRKEVKGAIRTCQEAGIKVVMITGDHPETARAIAAQVEINSARVLTGNEISKINDEELKRALIETFVFARVTPEDKLRLVRLFRESGEVVAVTGDGINDAPALKEADIGVAIGIRGTDVAKETADMVLTDDNFATIETAVKEGRKLFGNLRKGVRYYLACKVALVASFLLPIVLGVPLPFAPIQIIVLELFMDLAASATFVAEPEESGTMTKPPVDPKAKFMNRSLLSGISIGALSLFAAVTTNFLLVWFLTQNLIQAQTVAFATWMVGHILLALNFRSENQPLVKLGFISNKVMVLWAVLAAVTLIVGTSLPFVHDSLKITNLSLQDWFLVLSVSFIATFWIELKKILSSRSKTQSTVFQVYHSSN